MADLVDMIAEQEAREAEAVRAAAARRYLFAPHGHKQERLAALRAATAAALKAEVATKPEGRR